MAPTAPVHEIAATRAHARVRVLDVRNPDEFTAGHIPGAQFIPLPQLTSRIDDLDRRDRIYVVCESGSRAGEATRYLAGHGFDARPMAGGMAAWRSQGLPTAPGMLAMAGR